MTALYGVYGAGGCGRGIMPLLREQLRGVDARLVFIDDGAREGSINSHEVWSWARFMEEPAERRAACLAVANSRVREQLFERCIEATVEITAIRAANAVEMDDVEIGPGALSRHS